MSTFNVLPFTNKFGQVIQPGEEVIFVAESYKTVFVRKGIYEGYYEPLKSSQKRPRVRWKKKYSYDRGFSILHYGRIYKIDLTGDQITNIL